MILDLSSPTGSSVNDRINPEFYSLRYSSVDGAAQMIARFGRGSLPAKIDIAHAYKNVSVHPGDKYLLGMSWNGGIFVDTCLTFGLHLAPKVFNALADALE